MKKRLVSGLLALAALTQPALAHDDDRLHQIEAFFANANVLEGPELVDCTLSGGTQTSCFRITVTPTPQDYIPGPWCPSHVDDTAESGGIWFVDDKVADVDGAFVAALSKVYDDSDWRLFDPQTGAIRFTGSLESCEAAARPDVDAEYQNYCVQCLPEYMPKDASMTYTIPLDPVAARRPSGRLRAGAGVAYNGVRLDGPAPVDAILDAHTIAPFDDCGGHVNLHVGYHYHAVTDCLDNAPASSALATVETQTNTGHGPQIGIAMDGYQIFSQLLLDENVPLGLDSCNGHEGEGLGYHYHAGAAGGNAILGCHVAETGCVSEDGSAICDATKRRPRP